jgi:hypothetical protein
VSQTSRQRKATQSEGQCVVQLWVTVVASAPLKLSILFLTYKEPSASESLATVTTLMRRASLNVCEVGSNTVLPILSVEARCKRATAHPEPRPLVAGLWLLAPFGSYRT